LAHTRIWERPYWCSLNVTVVSTATDLKECRPQDLMLPNSSYNKKKFLFLKRDVYGLSH
jgi:hypothetical protein